MGGRIIPAEFPATKQLRTGELVRAIDRNTSAIERLAITLGHKFDYSTQAVEAALLIISKNVIP